MRLWPHKAAVYPVTICWEPSQDLTLSEDPWDTFSFRSIYPPEVQRVEKSTPEPPAAAANHRRGISDVITGSEREQQHEQERPAARRGGRRVGASELEGLGIRGGEEEAPPQEPQGAPEGRVTRTRRIRQPRRAPGDILQ
jgi:hypothetical protein